MWDKASALGWLGMLVPAEYGGSESSLMRRRGALEELGRGPLPGPFFSSGVLGALIVQEAGTPAARELLPGVARGERVLVAWPSASPNASWGRARRHARAGAAERRRPC